MAAVYVIVALAIAGSVARAPGTQLLGDTTTDAAGVARGLWLDRQVGQSPFSLTHDFFTGAPEGVPASPALTIVEPVQPGILWSLSSVIGDVGSINAFLLVSFFTTAFGAYLLCTRLLHLSTLASATAGFAAAFNPWTIEQALAGHLAFAMLWPLLALLAALAFVDIRRSAGSAALAGAAYGASFLTAAYLGLLATAIAIGGAIVIVWRTRSWADRLWLASLATVFLVVALALLTPGLVSYALHHSTTARIAGHGTATSEASGIWPQQYVNPAPFLRFLGSLHVGSRSLAFGSVESVAFFGYSTLLLAAVGVILVWRRRVAGNPLTRSFTLTCIAAAVLAFIVSTPPHLHLGRVTLPMPSNVIGVFTSYYRVYSRFAIVLGLCAVLLAAISIDAAWRRARPLGAVLALIVVLELWPAALPSWSTSARPLDRWLRSHPTGIVADYPQPTDSQAAVRLALTDLAYQPNNGDPLYTLLSGGTGGTREAAIRIMSRYLTDPATPSILAAEHVRYVLVDQATFAAEKTAAPTPSPAAFTAIGRVGPVRIYRLAKSVQPADLDSLLEQNAVSIGQVEGLAPPRTTYRGFSGPDASGWRTFGDGATIDLSAGGTSSQRAQLIVLVRSIGSAPTQLSVVDESTGAGAGGAALSTGGTQITLGPVGLSDASTHLLMQLAPSGARAQLKVVLVQPLADFSVSLAASP